MQFKRAIINRKMRNGLVASWMVLCFSVSQIATQAQIRLDQPLTVRWNYETNETLNLTPAIFGEDVFVPTAAGQIVRLQTADGSVVWRSDLGGEVSASPVANDRAVYVASEIPFPENFRVDYMRATGTVRALSRTSGVTLWMRTLPVALRGSLASNGQSLFGAATDGHIYSFDTTTGNINWVTQYRLRFASQIVIYNSKLYVGSEDGTLLSLNQTTGEPSWHYRTRGSVRGAVVVADGAVFFGSADGFVYSLEEATGRLRWRARTGASVQSVAFVNGGVVAASFDNFVYFFSSRRGARLWKRQLAGRIAAQPLIVERNVLLAPLSGDACVVLEAEGGRQVNTLPIGEGNNTGAAPVLARGGVVLITTRQGLIAFAPSRQSTVGARPPD
jgi:outer membrane protein assembly factor BamB